MLAPFENPTATGVCRREVGLPRAAATKSASSPARRASTSRTSNTPSASRRKKRGMPFSSTLPTRTQQRGARAASASPRGKRSSSSPPVPCSSSSDGRAPRDPAAGTNRCVEPQINQRHWPPADPAGNAGKPASMRRRSGSSQPAASLSASTQLGGSLVGRESRAVGRDLEQNPARLAEIDGLKVLPVHAPP